MFHNKLSTRLLASLGLAALTLMPQIAFSDNGRQYKVTITNLTAGQAFTPPVIATHTRDLEIFRVATISSAEIRAIAENGNIGPLVAALSSNEFVHDVVAGSAPLIPGGNPGNNTMFESSASFYITARGKARFLSFASMLICTNDGFTGINSVRLPAKKRVVYTAAYDARSEQNTEDFADIVPPCQGLIGVSSDDPGTDISNPLLMESGFIIPHPGIGGGNDLQPGTHNWSDPVARIVIERVRHKND